MTRRVIEVAAKDPEVFHLVWLGKRRAFCGQPAGESRRGGRCCGRCAATQDGMQYLGMWVEQPRTEIQRRGV